MRWNVVVAALAVAAATVPACGKLWTGYTAHVPWEASAAEDLGIDVQRLAELSDTLGARGTKAFLVAREGKLVHEWYAPQFGPDRRHYTASLAKALVGGMALLVALSDGSLQPDDPAHRYISSWRGDPARSQITVRHLATHSSGLEDAEEPGRRHTELGGWKGAFWRRDPDPFAIAIRDVPVRFDPGTAYAYSNPGFAALGYAITASRRVAPENDIRIMLRKRVMAPLGIPDRAWRIGYGTAYTTDGLSLRATWGGASYTARAVARVGQLLLERGTWGGRALLSPEWVDSAVTYSGTPPPDRSGGDPVPLSGLAWYTNADGVWSGVPGDAFAGAGAGHQILLVIPSLALVVVRLGDRLDRGAAPSGFWSSIQRHLFTPLMAAIAEPPYPPSHVIRRITFAPESTIVRAAVGSDNWPITWGDDGDQYTSFGDGWGFEPRVERKLSLGVARVVGGPRDFRGVNIRSESGERTGDGPIGPKASGLLMVDGVLHMWVRNASNARLAWSEDHGNTWKWGFRFDTSFGAPTFLQFGPNYAGARDQYVYVYSHDGPSAYEAADAIILARVPKTRIRERDAYEFFAGADDLGWASWTPHLSRRRAVLTYPGRCLRSDVVYHPGLGRYLLSIGFGMGGGWGIFDAPEPWGPWTTAYHTFDWGLRDTHSYRIPTKWVAPDGVRAYLLFSGLAPNQRGVLNYDAFAVREMQIVAYGTKKR